MRRVPGSPIVHRTRRGALALVLACVGGLGALAAPTVGEAAPAARRPEVASLDALLDGLAAMPGLQADFREEKRMALLAEPLVNEGSLHFSKGKLARHTVRPLRSSLIITGSRLDFGDEAGGESLDLDANPVIRLFVDSFTKIFAGDRAALERIYSLRFEPVDGGWVLELRPKVEPLDKVIERVRIEGRGLVLSRMVVLEIGGDETITTFTKVDVQRRYTPAELAEVFALRR